MTEHLATTSPDDLQTIAAALFARHGIDFATAHRGGGCWSAASLVSMLV